jgi:peroxiredoxin
VAFRPTKFERAIYNKILKADLKNAHSDESQQLPIPATFIIGKDGKIIWRHFDPDYKKRSTVDDIVKNIPK